MLFYRKKTRSNELVTPDQFKKGLVVWVDAPNGERLEYICLGYGVCVPVADYRHRKAEMAKRRRDNHDGRFSRRTALLQGRMSC